MFHVWKKPGYIPKEDILKELQQIDDLLTQLEQEGVQLETRLRRCEEGERSARRWRKARLHGRVCVG